MRLLSLAGTAVAMASMCCVAIAGRGSGERYDGVGEDCKVAAVCMVGMTREVDQNAMFPRAWQKCESRAECAYLAIGCGITAVNRKHLDAARRQSDRLLGDPRAMSCATRTGRRYLLGPVCVDARCGVWYRSNSE